MSDEPERLSDGDEAWYRAWFGREYLALYPHRDRDEARAAVRLLIEALQPSAGARVLDLACGAGRHLAALAAAGLRPVGLDLSAELLHRAACDALPPARLVRGDMRRLPFAPASFDVVASFFTSFGYFSTVEQDVQVLREIRRLLGRGGGFFLDFLNARHVRANLVPEDRRQVGERSVVQRRHIEGRSVVKEIAISGPGDTSPERYEERVRLYEFDELQAMLRDVGLRSEGLFGGYDGQPLGPGSERLILTGRRA